VLIAHVGAQTSSIRLGSGGIMLPNHSPLLIAEQFGTLEAMYPGRIDLGLGRAPGSDANTQYALRRDPRTADTFPRDVVELQGYLSDSSQVPGVNAVPGRGSNVPLYMLGSSLFGAKLAAALGLPYAFASHFAPGSLLDAVQAYRDEFKPSDTLKEPYVMAGVNVFAAPSAEEAREQLQAARRTRAASLFGRRTGLEPSQISDEQAEELLASGAALHVDEMMTYSAVGTGADVRAYLESFAAKTGADELITVHQVPRIEARLQSVTILAEAMPGA
jgi:luciferase family oxidoreductase group 1